MSALPIHAASSLFETGNSVPHTSDTPEQVFKQGTAREIVKIVIVGHVDHGKSTLVGRLLFETNALMEGKVAALKAMAERRGMPFEWAFLLDAFQAERDQGITIDTAQIWFKSPTRDYVLIDAPGHSEFLKNMITGAAQANVALLLVDAQEGMQEQSKRHAQLLALLGIEQLVVVVNKMDLVGYDETRFRAVAQACETHLAMLGLAAQAVVPVAARSGDNLNCLSPHMAWYQGPPLMAVMDALVLPASTARQQPLRFPIQDVYKFDARRILAGRIAQGEFRVGDTLNFWPSGAQAQVKSIEVWHAPSPTPTPTPTQAIAGQSVGITLDKPLFIERGSVATHAQAPNQPTLAQEVVVRLFWIADAPLQVGARYWLCVGTQRVIAHVMHVGSTLDADALTVAHNTELKRNQVADVRLRVPDNIVVDTSSRASLARAVLIEGYRIVAGGQVREAFDAQALKPRNRAIFLQGEQARALVPVSFAVSQEEWAQRNGHRAGVVLLTGLSGSGKSTLTLGAQRALFQRGWHVCVLDGDNLRAGLNADLSFSPEDRRRNVVRVAHVAHQIAQNGLLVLVSLIAPYAADRAEARRIIGAGFTEVYVQADLATCQLRDPKGFYAKALQGDIQGFTGVDALYEAPQAPDLTLNTATQSADESIAALVQALFVSYGLPDQSDAVL